MRTGLMCVILVCALSAVAQDMPPMEPGVQPPMEAGMGGPGESMMGGDMEHGQAMQKQRGRGQMDDGLAFERLLTRPWVREQIGVTDEQMTTLKTGMETLRAQREKLRVDMELASLTQAKLMMEDVVDEQAIMAAVEKSGAINTEMAKLRIKQMLLTKNTLSAEQIEKLKKMRQEFRNMSRGENGERTKQMEERRKKWSERPTPAGETSEPVAAEPVPAEPAPLE